MAVISANDSNSIAATMVFRKSRALSGRGELNVGDGNDVGRDRG
jgi:hypothetical protein